MNFGDYLEDYGRYFIVYTTNQGYDKILRALGSDFHGFAKNIDSVHTLLNMSYGNFTPPIFRLVHMQLIQIYLNRSIALI